MENPPAQLQVSDMDWPSLTERIASASRASFSHLIGQGTSERFYAFILYTDADCYTVLPSANSIEKHIEKISRQGVSEPKEMAGYKWYIGEWAYEAWKDEEFGEICQDLSMASQAACQMDTFPQFQQQVHSSMIEALALLDEEGLFDSIRNEIVLYISSTNYDEAVDLENRSAKILNSLETYEKFLTRYAVSEKESG